MAASKRSIRPSVRSDHRSSSPIATPRGRCPPWARRRARARRRCSGRPAACPRCRPPHAARRGERLERLERAPVRRAQPDAPADRVRSRDRSAPPPSAGRSATHSSFPTGSIAMPGVEPTGMRATTRRVSGSTRTTWPATGSAIQSEPKAERIPSGLPVSSSVATTRGVAGWGSSRSSSAPAATAITPRITASPAASAGEESRQRVSRSVCASEPPRASRSAASRSCSFRAGSRSPPSSV